MRQVRQHRHVSQARLARAIGVTVATIQHYERGRVRIPADRLAELAHVLQCESADLMRPPGSPPPRYRPWRSTSRSRPYRTIRAAGRMPDAWVGEDYDQMAWIIPLPFEEPPNEED